MTDVVDMTGMRCGRLVVLSRAENRDGKAYWHCRCDCGRQTVARGDGLRAGRVAGCGCMRGRQSLPKPDNYKPSKPPKHPEYYSWIAMLRRCYNPRSSDYRRYGGRGISVCERWRGPGGFARFLADMGPRPSPGHSIDRYPNRDGNYEPGNCRWATMQQQIRNSRKTKMTPESIRKVRELRAGGLTYRAVAEAVGVSEHTARSICVGDRWADVT